MLSLIYHTRTWVRYIWFQRQIKRSCWTTYILKKKKERDWESRNNSCLAPGLFDLQFSRQYMYLSILNQGVIFLFPYKVRSLFNRKREASTKSCRAWSFRILWSESRSVVSDASWPHGLYSPWNSPGQNTGVGSHSLLQGIFPTQGSNSGLPHLNQILYQLSHQGSPH